MNKSVKGLPSISTAIRSVPWVSLTCAPRDEANDMKTRILRIMSDSTAQPDGAAQVTARGCLRWPAGKMRAFPLRCYHESERISKGGIRMGPLGWQETVFI